jgi:hypothetical protein
MINILLTLGKLTPKKMLEKIGLRQRPQMTCERFMVKQIFPVFGTHKLIELINRNSRHDGMDMRVIVQIPSMGM